MCTQKFTLTFHTLTKILTGPDLV